METYGGQVSAIIETQVTTTLEKTFFHNACSFLPSHSLYSALHTQQIQRDPYFSFSLACTERSSLPTPFLQLLSEYGIQQTLSSVPG